KVRFRVAFRAPHALVARRRTASACLFTRRSRVREERGASQILFGFLPMQTVDLATGVWRVREWVDPVPIAIDQNAVRSALSEAIGRWTAAGQDGGLADELRTGAAIEVVSVNPHRGVLVESFPRQWRCRACGRISDDPSRKCPCGAGHKAQMHFVAYH